MAQANIRAVITAEDRASGTLKKFGGTADAVSGKIASTAKVAAAAFLAAATAATTFAVKSAADFQQTRVGLENMLGSADKARVLLAKISKFAAETPFEFPELAQATRQLIAFGFSAEEAFDTMKQLGDVSAAIGAPMDDIAYLMGTLRVQGRAFMIDIRQFAQRGIPIYEYLAKVLNTNEQAIAAMIKEGKIGFPEVQKAFQAMTAEGGKFHNTMDAQSRTLNGLFSTLKDTIGATARELVGISATGDIKEGSIFAGISNSVSRLNQELPAFIAYLKAEVFPQIQQWANNISVVAARISEYLSPKLQALWNTISSQLIPVLVRLWKEVLQPLAPIVGTTLVIALGAFIDGLNVTIKVISYLIGISLLLGNTTRAVWGAIIGVIVNAADVIGGQINRIQHWFNNLPGFIKGVLTGIYWIIAGPFVAAFDAIDGGISRIMWRMQQLKSALSSVNPMSNGGNLFQKVLDPAGIFRAAGGSVSANKPYIVGEQGAELFVPNKSGTIVPNNKMGGGQVNINVNVGMYAGSEMEKRKVAQDLFAALKDAASARGMTPSQMLGI